jgi:hypothetical protein
MKLLYTIGNLYKGYPYGVEAERQFGTVDLYGPFNGENEANTFAHRLVEDREALDCVPADAGLYLSVKVVRIETPQNEGSKVIVHKDGGYEYANA